MFWLRAYASCILALCEQALGNDYTSKDEFARLTWPALEKKIQGCEIVLLLYSGRRCCQPLIRRAAMSLSVRPPHLSLWQSDCSCVRCLLVAATSFRDQVGASQLAHKAGPDKSGLLRLSLMSRLDL